MIPLASSDTSALYETEHGSVAQIDDGLLRIVCDDLTLTVCANALPDLHTKLRTLSTSITEPLPSCRWQLRVPCLQQPVLVLDTKEMMALADLVGGATTMIELHTMLDGAEIALPK